jgi:exosortase
MILKLRTDWATNPQYEFGIFVPFFIIYLLGRRWTTRPPPEPDLHTGLILAVAVLALLFLLPIRIVQEANPDWRPLNWVHAATAIVVTLIPFARTGGSRWVRHFLLPFLLILFALPWPLQIEQATLQALTRAVSRTTVELLNWVNIPALQHGNVIEVFKGSVGVADACSGIRSLAGTLMAAAFFGEFYTLRFSRRLLLIVSGVTVAFALNLCRTLFLSWRASVEGVSSISAWHDPAGFTIFMASFATLWLLATILCNQEIERVADTVPITQ